MNIFRFYKMNVAENIMLNIDIPNRLLISQKGLGVINIIMQKEFYNQEPEVIFKKLIEI